MDQRAILDHQFTVAAYIITWVLQAGYLVWVGLKWRAEKRIERLNSGKSR
jgi:threonine/homoserine/homoserine lactone efflux protein